VCDDGCLGASRQLTVVCGPQAGTTPRNSSVPMRTLAAAAAAAAVTGESPGGVSMRSHPLRPAGVDIAAAAGDDTDSDLSPHTANGEFVQPESPNYASVVPVAAAGPGPGSSSRQPPAVVSKRPAMPPSTRR
jgi:hypothetical protein